MNFIRRIVTCSVLGASLVAINTASVTAASVSVTLSITAPLICKSEIAPESNGAFKVTEFCNSAYGYELVLETASAIEAGATAVVYDGLHHDLADAEEQISLRAIEQAHRGTYRLEFITESDSQAEILAEFSTENVALRYIPKG